jgi:hypothetical protein
MNSPYGTGRFADVNGLDQVQSHMDVARIVEQMLDDLRAHPDEWENFTLDRFLDALAACLDALLSPDSAEPMPTQPTWKLLAETLVRATGYE